MDKLSKNMVIDGVFASESLDTSGEILSVKGCDISDLQNGVGVLNFEHKGDSPVDILGKIVYARKIFGADDCEDERQFAYWNKVKLPFIYGRAELFDSEGHPGAVAAAALIRYYHRRSEPLLARFSIEGTTLDRKDNTLTRSFARRVALTLKPCNRACYSGVIFDEASDAAQKSEKEIFKGSYYETDVVVEDSLPSGNEVEKDFEDIEKALEEAPKPIVLTHYSNMPNLETIDPKFFGSGIASHISKLKIQDKGDPSGEKWVDRSYFYGPNSKMIDSELANKHKYHVELPQDAKIYDVHADHDNLVPLSMNPGGVTLNPLLYEKNIKDKGYFGYKRNDDTYVLFHPVKTVKLNKTLTLGGYGGAPSSRTGGSALQVEQWADPEAVKKNRANLLSAFRDWDRVTPIRTFLKNRLPEASDTYIERFAGLVDSYQVKKAEELFTALNKAFKIGKSIALFEDLRKQKDEGFFCSYTAELKKTGEELTIDLIGNRLRIRGGDIMPDEKVNGFFDLIKSGEISLKKKDNKPVEEQKAPSWCVYIELDDLPHLMQHTISSEAVMSVFRFIERVLDKHGGKASIKQFTHEAGGIQVEATFDSEERARGFVDDVACLKMKVATLDHAHNISFNMGMGKDPETAQKRLEESRNRRQSGDAELHYTTYDQEEPIEELQKAYGDTPDDKQKILRQLFRNHMLTSDYLKRSKELHSELSPSATEMQRFRAQLRIERSAASHVHTKKYLDEAIAQYHPEEHPDSVKARLFEDHLKGTKEYEDVMGAGTPPPPESEEIDEQPQGGLQAFLREQGFIGGKKKKKRKVWKTELQEIGEHQFVNQKHLEQFLKEGSFAVLSAHHKSRDIKQNEAADKALLDEIKSKHIYTPVHGRWNKSDEPSYMIHNISEEEASLLAKKYGQDAHIQSSGGIHKDVGHAQGYTPMPGGEGHVVDDSLDDNYSLVKFREGGTAKFRLNLDKDQSLEKKPVKILAHPHGYDWHDGHTDHHQDVEKAEPHPHSSPQGPSENPEAAGKGVSTYKDIASHFGSINPSGQTNLMHYDFRPHEGKIDQLIGKHGYQVYYAGGKYGKPDLATKNYNTKHLMVYDPSPGSGGDSGDEAYTRSWRKLHELSHALTYPNLNEKYGEGRRIGKLGHHRTLREAKRAVEWEHLAAHKQRELAESMGHKISDEDFAKEYNTVMHDAVHRAIHGKFTEPSMEGFVPHNKMIPLSHSLGMVHRAGKEMGLKGEEGLLGKSEGDGYLYIDTLISFLDQE